MTEGPRAHAVATIINELARGKTLEHAYTRIKRSRERLEELVGRRLDSAEAYGKNILFLFGDVAVRVHTLIYGRVRVYRSGEKYEKPEKHVWFKLVFGDVEVVGFNTPIVEVGSAVDIIRELTLKLGPDPLRDDWSRDMALKRLKEKCSEKIGVVLLDQSFIAGVGNIVRNEVLFNARVNPEKLVCILTTDEVSRILEQVESVSRKLYEAILRGENPKKYYSVYNRYRGVCLVCGTPIVYYKQQPCNRKTFICPNCQKL